MKSILLALLFCVACSQVSTTKRETDREHDGFIGPVRKVFEVWTPISSSDVPAGSRCRVMTNEYDVNGRLMRHSVYPGSCGVDEIREDYTYAQDGSRTEKAQEIRGKDSPPPPPPMARPSNSDEEKGEPKTVFKYGPTGKQIESAFIRPSGKIIYKTTYSYDNIGRMVEMTGHNEQGQVSSRRVYGYMGDERVPSSFAYYDGRGNVYERTIYSDYEFNSQGDWTKRKVSREQRFNRRDVFLMLREIEYYQVTK